MLLRGDTVVKEQANLVTSWQPNGVLHWKCVF